MAALLILLVLAWAPAPIPQLRKELKHVPHPTPGRYSVSWGASEDKDGVLHEDHTGWYMYFNTKYWFIWEWDPVNHLFRMWESTSRAIIMLGDKDGATLFTFYLDDELKSVKRDGVWSVPLTLKRKK